MEDSIDDLKGQITSGLLCLTVEEDDAVQSLVDIFPHYSLCGLKAVVVLHNRHLQSAADQLVACCVSFLFSDDGISLAHILCPMSSSDPGPEIFGTGRIDLPSFTTGVSSASQRASATTSASTSTTVSTSSTIPDLTADVLLSHRSSACSIASKAAASSATLDVYRPLSLSGPSPVLSHCSSLPSASSPASGLSLSQVSSVSIVNSANCPSGSVITPEPLSNSSACAASCEVLPVTKATNFDSVLDVAASSDLSGGNLCDHDPKSQPSSSPGKSELHWSAQRNSLSKTVKSEFESKDSSYQPSENESSCDSLPDLDFNVSKSMVTSTGSESVSFSTPFPGSLCSPQPHVGKDANGLCLNSQNCMCSDGSQLSELSNILTTRKRKSGKHNTWPDLVNPPVIDGKRAVWHAESDSHQIQNWNVDEERISRKKKVLPISSIATSVHLTEGLLAEKTWRSCNTEECPPLSNQKGAVGDDDKDIFEEEALFDDHAENLPIIGPPKRKRLNFPVSDETVSTITERPLCSSVLPVAKPPVFNSVKYLGTTSLYAKSGAATSPSKSLPTAGTISISDTDRPSVLGVASPLKTSASALSESFPVVVSIGNDIASSVIVSTSETTTKLVPDTSSSSSRMCLTTSCCTSISTSTVRPFSFTSSAASSLPSSTSNSFSILSATSGAASNPCPSTSNDMANRLCVSAKDFPSANNSTSALSPSISSYTTTSMLLLSTANNAISTHVSISNATSELSSSTSSSASNPSPSTGDSHNMAFPANSSVTSILLPSTNSSPSTPFPSTNDASSILFPSSSSASDLCFATSSSGSNMHLLSTSCYTSTSATNFCTSSGFLSSNSANMPILSSTSGTSKTLSTASASATSNYIPDPRDNLQKRLDSLNAKFLGLIDTTDTLCVDYKSDDPYHIHSQAAPLASSSFTAWRSSPAVKSLSCAPPKTVSGMHSITDPTTNAVEITGSSHGLTGGLQARSVAAVSVPVSGTAYKSFPTGSRQEYDSLNLTRPSNPTSVLSPAWSVSDILGDTYGTRLKQKEGSAFPATITAGLRGEESTVVNTSTGNASVSPVKAGRFTYNSNLTTQPSGDSSVNSTVSLSSSAKEKNNASTATQYTSVSFANAQHNNSVTGTPLFSQTLGEKSSTSPVLFSVSSHPASFQPQVSQTRAPANAMLASDAGEKRAVLSLPVVTVHLDPAQIPSSSSNSKAKGGGFVLAPSRFGRDGVKDNYLTGQDNGGAQQPQLPLGPVAGVDAAEPMVLDDSQDSVEIVAATPSNNIVIDLSVPGPSELDIAAQPAVSPVASADVIDLEVPGPSRIDSALNQGLPERNLQLDFGIIKVLEVFPGTDHAYVRQLLETFLETYTLDEALNHTMGALLDTPQTVNVTHPDNPQLLQQEITVVHMQTSSSTSAGQDYYTNYSNLSPVNTGVVADRLSMDFRNVRMDTIYAVLKHYNNHYAPAHRCLSRALHAALLDLEKNKTKNSTSRLSAIKLTFNEGKTNEKTMKVSLMKGLRQYFSARLHEDNIQLAEEVEFVAHRAQMDKEEVDRKVAWELLEAEYEQEGQAIECGCCYTEQPFENLVQCFEGHLFCCQCLLGYAREAIYGSGKLHLACMTENCDSTFPKSQLLKALPNDVMAKYDERIVEENLNKAAMPDLVRCPRCNLAAVLDQNIQNFKCPNANCRKETCRDCKEDWAEHKGKKCHQLEKKDETKLRIDYEEKMTAARVRMCPSCHAQFFKEEGCNKMTCRCGATMCYICRSPQISYKHFCRHPRDPGQGCTKCNSCSLWTNPDEDEQRAIAEIQKEAQEKRKEQGFLDDKVIGVPEKRQRTK